MQAHFEFEPEKSLAVCAYLADRSGETMYTILKMVYAVDRLHLERYGRPVTGDRFIAMEEGACPSKIYDSMKYLRGEKNKQNWMPSSETFLSVDPETHDVEIIDMPSMDVLSETDIECIDAVISALKRNGRWHIRNLAHDGAWKATDKNKEMDLMKIAESLKDGQILVKHLADRFPGSA